MPIQHTQLNKIDFTEAVKRTTPYLKEDAGIIRKAIVNTKNIDSMFEYYGQACRNGGIEYLKDKPYISSRYVKIINEIINESR